MSYTPKGIYTAIVTPFDARDEFGEFLLPDDVMILPGQGVQPAAQLAHQRQWHGAR